MISRLLLIGDVGGLGLAHRWHVGDEAMLAAGLTWLRREAPAAEPIAASSAPAWTNRLYGVEAMAFLDFGDDTSTQTARELCRAAVAAARSASRRPSQYADPPSALAATVDSVDCVLFCGAGNLSSAFPNRLYERLAAARMARLLGKPYAFNAQTIGPLSPDDAAELRDVLADAVYIAVRDASSADELDRMGVAAIPMQDDAVHASPLGQRTQVGGGRIGVTVHASPMADRPLDMAALAETVGHIAARADASVTFIPHFRGPENRWSDLDCAAELASRLPVPTTIAPWGPVDAVRAETAACSFVLSTRYHPVVFAACAGVPAIGLYQDAYHRAKLGGILTAYGVPDRMFPVTDEGLRAAASAGGELATNPADAELLDRHTRIIELDNGTRRSCLARFGGDA